MSQAKLTFDAAIQDAEELLGHFDRINSQPPPPNAEVLKRAGLIMAFTAWETYVEDRVCEALAARLAGEGDGPSARFVQRRLDEELKKFNNPNTEKTKRLFQEFLEIDVTASWKWNQYDVTKVKTTLDTLIAKRGAAVHRSSPKRGGPPAPHLVTKEELKKAIGFLKSLVKHAHGIIAHQRDFVAVGLSGFLCARHIMTTNRSQYAKQAQAALWGEACS